MRRVSLILGLLILALIWAGPLLDAWRNSFAAHMLAHMGVVAIAAPLIAIGVSARIPPMATSVPVIASLVELVVVWGWHAPAARLWVEGSTFATILEQASFLAAGLLLWLTCHRTERNAGPGCRRRLRTAAYLRPHDAARRAAFARLAPALRRRRSDLLRPRARRTGRSGARWHHHADDRRSRLPRRRRLPAVRGF